jgi:hypothetical protein
MEPGAMEECSASSTATAPASETRRDDAATAVAIAAEMAPRKSLFERWAPLLLKFASVQVVVQAIGFAAGILVVRNLPKREYALYTLCNTMLATILVLADSGIGSALTAIGGRVWQSRYRLSQLIRTALHLRRFLAMVALPVVIPVLFWLLRQNGASFSRSLLLVSAVLLGCSFELVTRIYVVALRLMSAVRQIQNQALVATLLRFAIVVVAVLTFFNVEIAILAVVAGFIAQYWMLRRWHTVHLDAKVPVDAEMRGEILGVVRKQAPHSIYYCLQGQLMVWLISVFGNADRVAEVGALARLAVVFAILGSLASEVLYPAFARIQNVALLRRRYLQIIAGFVGVFVLLIGVVAVFPRQFIYILGGQYSHLQTEGILMAISTVLGAIDGLTWTLNITRAWIIPPLQFFAFDITLLVVLIHYLDMSTVRGVLLLSILSTIPSIAWAITFGLLQIRRLQAATA